MNNEQRIACGEQLAAWKDNAEMPELISAFYYFPADIKDPAYRYDDASAKFVEADPSDDIAAFRDEISRSDGRNFFEERTALVITRFTESRPNQIFVTVDPTRGAPPPAFLAPGPAARTDRC